MIFKFTKNILFYLGSAIERSQLLVYDVSNMTNPSYHISADTDIAEARVALMEKTVDIQTVFPDTSTSLRLVWRVVQPHQYIEGYLINYREARPRNGFSSIKAWISFSYWDASNSNFIHKLDHWT